MDIQPGRTGTRRRPASPGATAPLRPDPTGRHGLARPAARALLALLPVLLMLAGCGDHRKPLDSQGEAGGLPILELSTDQEIISAAKDTFITVRALLVNSDHGTLPGRRISFSARIGYIASQDSTNDSGVAQTFYYSRVGKLSKPAVDTVVATYSGGGAEVRAILPIKLIPGGGSGSSDSVGSLVLVSSRTDVQVKGTGNNDQAVISARVYDVFGNPIKDGTRVVFRVLRGPGGGEALGNGATDTASTRGGAASVTFRAGIRIGVVEVEASAMGQTARQSLLTVTSGPPERLDIVVRADSTVTEGNRWRMQVQAVITDIYLNPVKDSIGVLFTLDPRQSNPASVSIEGSAFTGNLRCADTTEVDCRAVPGSAFTVVAYRSEVIFDSLSVTAETVTGNRVITGSKAFKAPLQRPVLRANYYGGAVFAPEFQPVEDIDTLEIVGVLKDGLGAPVPGARVCIQTDGGVVLDICKPTDAAGEARYRMTVSSRDQTSLALSRVINVMLVEQSTGASGLTSFLAIFN